MSASKQQERYAASLAVLLSAGIQATHDILHPLVDLLNRRKTSYIGCSAFLLPRTYQIYPTICGIIDIQNTIPAEIFTPGIGGCCRLGGS